MSGTDDLKELRDLTKDHDETEVGEANTNNDDAPYPIISPYDNDEDEPGTLKENAKLWAKVGDTYFPADPTVSRLEAGQYSIEYSHSRGIYFAPKTVNLDDLLILPESSQDEIVN